jgi:hypothetical protein
MTINEIFRLPDGLERTARLVAWVQSLFGGKETPVLVGGAAVELLTGGAYTTGDLDLVGTVSPAVADALVAEGFARSGRHWVHERAQVFLEFPSSALAEGEKAVLLRVAGCDLLAISPEDLMAERLAAWKHWRSMVDGVNAWLLLRAQRAVLDQRRLVERCRAHDAGDALAALRAFAGRHGNRAVADSEVEAWAQKGP